MTTLDAIDTIGSYKLGGKYTDESVANSQLRLLSLLNTARQKVLQGYYMSTKAVPQVCYQEFDLVPIWEDEKCISFACRVPVIMNFPPPQLNGWDAVMPKCDGAMPLVEIKTRNQLRTYRNNPYMGGAPTSGYYFTNGSIMEGFLKPNVKADGLTGRGILTEPQTVPNFNMELDEYPMPEDMFSDVKKLLEGDDGRRWFRIVTDQISNSRVDADAAATSTRR